MHCAIEQMLAAVKCIEDQFTQNSSQIGCVVGQATPVYNQVVRTLQPMNLFKDTLCGF